MILKTYENHLCSVSIAASQRLCILRNSWRIFHDRLLLGRCCRGFALHVLEYCSEVWCPAADTHLKLLDRAVSGARFLIGVCLSVTSSICGNVINIYVCCTRTGVTRCTHPLYGALPVPYVPVRVTCSALLAVYLCTSSLWKLAVPQDFYSPSSISVERSW